MCDFGWFSSNIWDLILHLVSEEPEQVILELSQLQKVGKPDSAHPAGLFPRRTLEKPCAGWVFLPANVFGRGKSRVEPRPLAMTPRPGSLKARPEQVRVQDVSGFFPEASRARAEGNISKLAACRLGQPSSGLTRGKLTAGGQEVWFWAGCMHGCEDACPCPCLRMCWCS